MFFIFLSIVLGIIGEIFLVRLYKDGGKQLVKYDKEHSDLQFASAEEFVAKVKSIHNLGVSKVEGNGNRVSLICQKNKYIINVENGIAAVEYDKSGCGVKISRIGRILKMFRFSKAAHKAVVINAMMDCVAGKECTENAADYKKVKNERTAFYMFFIAFLVFLFIGIYNMLGNLHEEAISKVKNTEYTTGVTYEELVDGYLKVSEWTVFNSDNDTAIVEVNGTSVENEQICIQFSGDSGMGLTDVGRQDFSLRYFEADGESLDPNAAMEYVFEYLNN